MPDKARAHTAHVYMTFINDKGISVMNWIARSPDLNPIEHTWDIRSTRIRQRPPYPEKVQNIVDVLGQKLQIMPQKRTGSMPHRCQECVDDRGGHTSYW